jgi:Cu-Zn family superoxide dismutase
MTIGTRQVGIGLALAAAVGFRCARTVPRRRWRPVAHRATLNPTQGSTVKGKVEFKPAKGGVLVTAHIEGLTPGTHGFHVHEKGDCSAPTAPRPAATSTRRRSPTPRATPRSATRATSATSRPTRRAFAEVKFRGRAAQARRPEGILGRGVIVHEKAGRLHHPATGNAGGRKACGVVESAATEKPE